MLHDNKIEITTLLWIKFGEITFFRLDIFRQIAVYIKQKFYHLKYFHDINDFTSIMIQKMATRKEDDDPPTETRELRHSPRPSLVAARFSVWFICLCGLKINGLTATRPLHFSTTLTDLLLGHNTIDFCENVVKSGFNVS